MADGVFGQVKQAYICPVLQNKTRDILAGTFLQGQAARYIETIELLQEGDGQAHGNGGRHQHIDGRGSGRCAAFQRHQLFIL